MFKHPRLPIFLFISSSLVSLLLLPIFYIFFKTLFINNTSSTATQEKNSAIKATGLRDPLITKAPDLKDVITGPVINNNDPSMGAENAPVVIVEFSDFTCSFCQLEETRLKQIVNLYKDKIRLIWKDYPENNPASISWQAAKAARCSGEQNNFWPYHDLLFLDNKNLSQTKFIELAQRLNLNEEKFKECLASKETNNYLKQNVNEANALEITGVPFIYVNDQEVMGEVSWEELKDIIESELKK